MRLRLVLLMTLASFLATGCASSINTVYKTQSMTDDDPYARITVNGVSTTITHVYTPGEGDQVKVDPVVPKDSPTMEVAKIAYAFTPWGLLTRAVNPGSTGVYRVPPGKVVLQIFNRRNIPVVAKNGQTNQVIMMGYYSFLAGTLKDGVGYELDAPEQWGRPPILDPQGPDFRVLTGPELSEILVDPASESGKEVAK